MGKFQIENWVMLYGKIPCSHARFPLKCASLSKCTSPKPLKGRSKKKNFQVIFWNYSDFLKIYRKWIQWIPCEILWYLEAKIMAI